MLSPNIDDRERDKFTERNGKTVVRTVNPQVYNTPFGESSVTNRSVVFDIKANVPSVSQIRNNVITTGTGSVSISNGEFQVTVPSGSTVLLESSERGRYTPGYVSQAGIGFRLPAVTFEGTSYAEWGYFQGIAGIGFGADATGTYVFVNNNGTKTKTYQSDWNIDKLTGSGPSGATLDLSQGNIYQIDYIWYGYGAITFSVQLKDGDTFGQPIHRFVPSNGVSINQPNLHVSAFVKNDAQTSFNAYVGGRQYSIYGQLSKQSRITGEYVTAKSVSTSWTPLITFKRKASSFEQEAQTCTIDSASVSSTSDLIYTYFYNATLTGATFGNPSAHDANETVLEVDTAATALTGGFAVGPKTVVIGGQGNTVLKTESDDFRFNVIQGNNITLAARTISGTGTVSVAAFNMSEDW